jgi:hypothetical protein
MRRWIAPKAPLYRRFPVSIPPFHEVLKKFLDQAIQYGLLTGEVIIDRCLVDVCRAGDGVYPRAAEPVCRKQAFRRAQYVHPALILRLIFGNHIKISCLSTERLDELYQALYI